MLHPNAAPLMALVGKWFTFWAVGVRLFLAGASQVFRPQFTLQGILGVKDPGANVIVRELGFANISMGTLGLLSLVYPAWVVPEHCGRLVLRSGGGRACPARGTERQRADRARL
jgi:hypothetical protein